MVPADVVHLGDALASFAAFAALAVQALPMEVARLTAALGAWGGVLASTLAWATRFVMAKALTLRARWASSSARAFARGAHPLWVALAEAVVARKFSLLVILALAVALAGGVQAVVLATLLRPTRRTALTGSWVSGLYLPRVWALTGNPDG